MKSNPKDMNTTNNPYAIELVSDFGLTYYQVVRKADEAILYANGNIDNIASFILDEGIDIAGFDAVPEFNGNHIF